MGYIWNFVFQLTSAMWIGSAVALSNELVLPRMRATASAYYILAVTFIGLALGPFTIGQISDRLAKAGTEASEALGQAMVAGLIAYVIGIVFLWLSSRWVIDEERTRLERAAALGEPVQSS